MPFRTEGSRKPYFGRTQTLNRLTHANESIVPFGIVDARMGNKSGDVRLIKPLSPGEECTLNGEPLAYNISRQTKPGDKVTYVSSNGRLRFTITHS